MRLFVLGATGRTGIPFVRQALNAGHSITAYIRNPDKVTSAGLKHDRLNLIQGSLDDAECVQQSMTSHDAIVSLLSSDPSPHDQLSSAARNAITAMQRPEGPKRFVTVSGFGVGPTRSQLSAGSRFVLDVSMFFAGLKKSAADHELMINELAAAENVDYTVLLPSMLGDGPLTAKYQSGSHDNTEFISKHMSIWKTLHREDLAHCALAAVTAAPDASLPKLLCVCGR